MNILEAVKEKSPMQKAWEQIIFSDTLRKIPLLELSSKVSHKDVFEMGWNAAIEHSEKMKT